MSNGLDLENLISGLRRNRKVYIHESPLVSKDPDWLKCQEREKAFWKHKINHTDYNPDPKKNFMPFLGHWGIAPSFFKGKSVLEIGSGPFGFFSGLERMNPDYLPEELVVVDALLDFYQQFKLSDMMPEKAIRLETVGEDIPLPDETFDAIVTTNTLDHVQDYDALLRESRRLLKEGGTLLFSVHALKGIFAFFRPFVKIADATHHYHFTADDVRRLMDENFFALESSLSVPVYREDAIPCELGPMKKVVYFIGFCLMGTFYGTARKKP